MPFPIHSLLPFALALSLIGITGCEHLESVRAPFLDRYADALLGRIPGRYTGLENPLPPDRSGSGEALYRTHCVACHGERGRGDGPLAASLSPPPADLSRSLALPVVTDAFILWAIEEGGERYGSAMPAFGDRLTRNQIWQIARFLERNITLNDTR